MKYFKWEQGPSKWYLPTSSVTCIEEDYYGYYTVYMSDQRCFRFVSKPEEIDLGE